MRNQFSTLFSCLASIPVAALLAGCAGMTTTASPVAQTGNPIKGMVHGGQQPVVGAHVYLMQANVTAYGAASVSSLNATSTGNSDSIGAYTLTGSDGSFTITGDYSCTPQRQYYLYALGGNPGAGTNANAGFLAAIGACPSNGTFASTIPYVFINEVSTVVAAYSFAGFAVDATHVSANTTPLSQTGLANAFLSASNLANLATGTAYTTTPAGNGTVPVNTINALANILAACVNSNPTSSTTCATLLAAAKSGGTTGTTPTDTATAAINIAHNPASNVAALFALSTASPQFPSTMTQAPNDWLVAVGYSGAGSNGGGINGAYSVAVDAEGAVWFTNVNTGSVSKLSSTGAAESPAAGFANAALAIPTGIAIDLSENAWTVDAAANHIIELSGGGVPAGTFTGGGLFTPEGVAIDGSSNEWVVNGGGNSLSKFSSNGTAISPATVGYTGGGITHPNAVAIDNTGAVWITNNPDPTAGGIPSVSKFSSAGVAISNSNGYTGAGLKTPKAIAIDASNDAWVANFDGNSVSGFSPSGTPLSSGFTGGGLSSPYALAIDGNGNIWVANYGNATVSEFSNAGTAVSPASGFSGGMVGAGPSGIDIDGSGNVWIANQLASSTSTNAVTQLVGAAVPRVTPLAAAVKGGTLGARP